MKTVLINKADLIKEIEKEKNASAILTSCCESYQEACAVLDLAIDIIDSMEIYEIEEEDEA